MSHGGEGVWPRNSGPNWTAEQNKSFENGLAIFGPEESDRWHRIAKMVGGGATEEDVRRQYEILLEDIDKIESGKIPTPKYSKNQVAATNGSGNKSLETKLKNIKF